MKAHFRTLTMLILFSSLLNSGGDRLWSSEPGLVAHWSFDEMTSEGVRDSVSGTVDPIQGLRKLVPGVSGSGLRLDGYTTHIAGTFDADRGLTVYIDGKEAGRLAVKGKLQLAYRSEILIGRVHEPSLTYPAYWPWHKVWYSLDGILDEMSIFDSGLTADEVEKLYASRKAPEGEVLPWPVLPSAPKGAGKFGAYYTTLKYEEVWEAGRRVGPNSDVVVRFDAGALVWDMNSPQ